MRTSYLEINKTLKLRDPGSIPEGAWIFFQVLFSTTHFSSFLCWEDLLISFLHSSANI